MIAGVTEKTITNDAPDRDGRPAGGNNAQAVPSAMSAVGHATKASATARSVSTTPRPDREPRENGDQRGQFEGHHGKSDVLVRSLSSRVGPEHCEVRTVRGQRTPSVRSMALTPRASFARCETRTTPAGGFFCCTPCVRIEPPGGLTIDIDRCFIVGAWAGERARRSLLEFHCARGNVEA